MRRTANRVPGPRRGGTQPQLAPTTGQTEYTRRPIPRGEAHKQHKQQSPSPRRREATRIAQSPAGRRPNSAQSRDRETNAAQTPSATANTKHTTSTHPESVYPPAGECGANTRPTTCHHTRPLTTRQCNNTGKKRRGRHPLTTTAHPVTVEQDSTESKKNNQRMGTISKKNNTDNS